ncbi:MAG TPA: hypothetical protein VK454_08615 [Myxococcaceae bacterium]|nr:hypothetical protein [Myxococcaceae bacterium]
MAQPPLSPVLRVSHGVFTSLHARWESRRVQRILANGLVAVFLGAFCLIEARRRGWLPDAIAPWIPTNHFYSVQLAFTLLLAVEVISLVFGMSAGTGTAMGKQFENLSLILLRQSLKELVNFPEPIRWDAVRDAIPRMLADASAAVLVFGLLGVFYRLQRRSESRLSEDEQARFMASKELVALGLLAIFVGLGLDGLVGNPVRPASARADYFFEQFYTVLVFADILIVLLALRHGFEYDLVFRNSGFAAVTVLIRLALTAPPFVNGALGVGAMVLGIGLTWAYNRNVPVLRPPEAVDSGAPRPSRER